MLNCCVPGHRVPSSTTCRHRDGTRVELLLGHGRVVPPSTTCKHRDGSRVELLGHGEPCTIVYYVQTLRWQPCLTVEIRSAVYHRLPLPNTETLAALDSCWDTERRVLPSTTCRHRDGIRVGLLLEHGAPVLHLQNTVPTLVWIRVDSSTPSRKWYRPFTLARTLSYAYQETV